MFTSFVLVKKDLIRFECGELDFTEKQNQYHCRGEDGSICVVPKVFITDEMKNSRYISFTVDLRTYVFENPTYDPAVIMEGEEYATSKTKICWEDKMTKLLIALVNERTPLVPSEYKSKAVMYNSIATDLQLQGYLVSAQQCADKMKSLMKSYKSIVHHNKKTGVAPKTCPYNMNEIEDTLMAKQHNIMPLFLSGNKPQLQAQKRGINESDTDDSFVTAITSTPVRRPISLANTNDTTVSVNSGCQSSLRNMSQNWSEDDADLHGYEEERAIDNLENETSAPMDNMQTENPANDVASD